MRQYMITLAKKVILRTTIRIAAGGYHRDQHTWCNIDGGDVDVVRESVHDLFE